MFAQNTEARSKSASRGRTTQIKQPFTRKKEVPTTAQETEIKMSNLNFNVSASKESVVELDLRAAKNAPGKVTAADYDDG